MNITLEGRTLGPGHPALLVAELGINHGGSLDVALQMVRAAAEAGADAVKVQAFDSAGFCTKAATWKGESQLDMFKRYELGGVELAAIAHECRTWGMMFFGTPDSMQHAEQLLAMGAPCLKVGSDDLIHLPLLRGLASYRVPLILSTGMGDSQEIADALDAVAGCPTILLHCVSEYPTPPEHANLKRMVSLRGSGRLIGYSDHTDGISAAVGAIYLGACLIEKHFTLDRDGNGPDHAFSADPQQFENMAHLVREAERMLGAGRTDPRKEEKAMRVTARRSVVAAQDLAQGEKITSSMLAFKRPGDGLPPRMADEIVGRRLTRALAADEQVREGDWA